MYVFPPFSTLSPHPSSIPSLLPFSLFLFSPLPRVSFPSNYMKRSRGDHEQCDEHVLPLWTHRPVHAHPLLRRHSHSLSHGYPRSLSLSPSPPLPLIFLSLVSFLCLGNFEMAEDGVKHAFVLQHSDVVAGNLLHFPILSSLALPSSSFLTSSISSSSLLLLFFSLSFCYR